MEYCALIFKKIALLFLNTILQNCKLQKYFVKKILANSINLENTMKNVKVYGADWCSDCVTAKKFLESKKIDFEYIDITKDELAVRFVENVNDGKRIIPTLVIDGKTHTNPGIAGLIRLFN